MFTLFPAAIFVFLGRVQKWHLHNESYKFLLHMLKNNSAAENCTDVRLGQVVNLSIFYTVWKSWLQTSKVLILVFDGVTVKTTNCVMGQCKMQTADWLRTIVFRVRKQWDYCCHVLICTVKTIVCSLRFTLTYSVILLFLFMFYIICCGSEYKIFIITRPISPFGE